MKAFDYKGYLEGLGIEKGDVLDIASDIVSIAYFAEQNKMSFDMDELIDRLCEAVGEEGTIMIRTFTWDFCKGKPFDFCHSRSRVGVLGNIALKRDDFIRTKHPIYSWCVKGKFAKLLAGMENVESFGIGTPWEFLQSTNGKFLVLGEVEGTALTVVHHYEKLAKVPYREEKVFESEYIDNEGNKSVRRYTMFVRPLNITFNGTDDYFYAAREKWIHMGKMGGKIFKGGLPAYCYPYKLLKVFFEEEILQKHSEDILGYNGGWDKCGIDWGQARYYGFN